MRDNKLHRYHEKYFLNGNRYYKVATPTIIQNKASGRIKGTFKTDKATADIIRIFSSTNGAGSSRLEMNTSGTGIRFVTNNSSLSSNWAVSAGSIGEYSDGNIHTFDVTFDGLNSSITVDSVLLSSTITPQTGTPYFIDNNLTVCIIGAFIRTDLSISDYFKGNVYDITIYDTNLTDILYSASFDNENITASATTIAVYNTSINLKFLNNYNNSGDDNVTITPANSPIFTTSFYGSANNALLLNGTSQYLSLNNNSKIQAVLFRIKATANNRDILELATGKKISINTSNEIVTTGLTNSVIKVNGAIKHTIELNRYQLVYVEFDEITALNSIIGYSATYFSGIIDNVIFYKYKISAEELKAEFKKYPKI